MIEPHQHSVYCNLSRTLKENEYNEWLNVTIEMVGNQCYKLNRLALHICNFFFCRFCIFCRKQNKDLFNLLLNSFGVYFIEWFLNCCHEKHKFHRNYTFFEKLITLLFITNFRFFFSLWKWLLLIWIWCLFQGYRKYSNLKYFVVFTEEKT